MATTDDSAVQARLEEGATMYEEGNLYGAIVAWKDVLAMDPDNGVAQEYLGFIEEEFQIGVDALLAHHEAAMGGAPLLSSPPAPAPVIAEPPPPPPAPGAPSDAAQPIPPVPPTAAAPSIEIEVPRPPVRTRLPSEPALPLEPPAADSDGPSALFSDDLGPGASIDDLPAGLPSSSIDVPLFADPNDFMRTPPSDFPQVQRPPTVEPLGAELPPPAEVDPLAGMDPLLVASNIDAAFDALLAPSDSIEVPPEDVSDLDAAPVALPVSPIAPVIDELEFGDAIAAAFSSIEGPFDSADEPQHSAESPDTAPRSLLDALRDSAIDDGPLFDSTEQLPFESDENDAEFESVNGLALESMGDPDAALQAGAHDGFDAAGLAPIDADAGAQFEADEGIPFEPEEEDASAERLPADPGRVSDGPVRALLTPQIAVGQAPTAPPPTAPPPTAPPPTATPPTSRPPISRRPSASRPGSGVRHASGPIRVTPPKRRESLPMRGEPRSSGVRPGSSGERPAASGESPSRSVERAADRESVRQTHPSASQERARQRDPAVPSPLDGHAPVDSIEEMDWSEILEDGAAEDSAPEIQRPDGDEAFFIEMESDRQGVEPGNEAAAWGVSGTPISAPIVQHQSAPTRDPFVMPASHFVDLPDEVFADEVFADEPSIPDTWAEAPEPDDLSDGSIDIMVDQDFQSWDQPVVKTDPFAQAHAADDGWGAAANVFDESDTGAPGGREGADEPGLAFAAPALEPDDDVRIIADSIEVPIPVLDEEDTPRTTQELVSAPTPPSGFDAKPGPPPVAQQTPTSLPPLPGDPEDGPLYGAGNDDLLSAGEAPDWLSPTFEPGPAAAPGASTLGDAFAPPGETDFFGLGDEIPVGEDDVFRLSNDAESDPSLDFDPGSILVETRTAIEEAPTLDLPNMSSLSRRALPADAALPGDEPIAAAAIFGRKRRGGAVERTAVAEARRQEKTPPVAPVAIAIDPDIEALLRSGFEDLDAIESTGSQSLEVRQRVPSRPAHGVDVDALMEQARQKQAAGDFSGSLELVEQVLLAHPDEPRAQAYMAQNTAQLLDMYRSRLGPLTRMPRVKLRPEEIIWQALDHRAGFLLSQVDGRTSYEDLIEIAGMSELEATRTLARLVGYELIG